MEQTMDNTASVKSDDKVSEPIEPNDPDNITPIKKTTVIEDIGDIWADVLDCVDRNSSLNNNLVKSETVNNSGDIFDEVLHYHEPIRKDDKTDQKSQTQTTSNTNKKFKKQNKYKR